VGLGCKGDWLLIERGWLLDGKGESFDEVCSSPDSFDGEEAENTSLR